MSNNEFLDKNPLSANFQRIDPKYLPPVFGGGNLNSVLASGNSAGCQSMTDVFGMSGCPSIDLQITSVGPNSDVILENNTAGDGIILNAGTSIQLNTDQFASGQNTSIQLNAGNTVISPNIGYPYPAVVETGVSISQYTNPSAGGQQIGLSVDNITTGGQCDGIVVSNIQSTAGTCYGEKINNIGGIGAVGLEIATVSSSASRAYGINMNSITSNGLSFARGINVVAVTALNSEATGVFVGGVTTDPATGGEPMGIHVVNTSNAGTATVYGVRSQGNQSNVGDCYGVHISDNQSASGRAYGLFSQRAGKPANSDGVLMRLRDGSLGFGVPQVVDAGTTTWFNDGGNLVIIDATAPIGVFVTSPPNGFEDGLFFLLTRNSATAYVIGSTSPTDGFNGAGPGSTYNWVLGGAYDMLIMFYSSSNWFIKGF